MFKILLTLSLLTAPLYAKEITLTTANTVNMRGQVNPGSVASWMSELQKAVQVRGSSIYPIYLVIDSPGGSIEAGFVFVEYLKSLKNVHTITIFGASMASAIAMGNPGKRYVTDSGIFMFHRAYAGIKGHVEVGELESKLAIIKARVQRLERMNYSRIGISKQSYKERVMIEWWLDSDQAVAANVADEKIDIKCTQKLIEKTFVQQIATMFGMVESVESECPLFRFGIK